MMEARRAIAGDPTRHVRDAGLQNLPRARPILMDGE